MAGNEVSNPCRRCHINASDLVVRSEPLCQSCFTAYVRTKIIKRMPTFRSKNARSERQQTFLLPLSFGLSSISVLHTLSAHQKYQEERTGRAAYRLHVLHV